MRRRILLMIGLALALAAPAAAATFAPAPLAPDLGLDALTRRVTRDQLGKNLFGDPWAAVTPSVARAMAERVVASFVMWRNSSADLRFA